MPSMGKDLRKAARLLLVGLAVALFVYPFLHELGHALAAVAVGARVVELRLLPQPWVMCDVLVGVPPAGQNRSGGQG